MNPEIFIPIIELFLFYLRVKNPIIWIFDILKCRNRYAPGNLS